MNPDTPPPPPENPTPEPAPAAAQPPPSPPSPTGIIEALLKQPAALTSAFKSNGVRTTLHLAGCAVVCLLVFGFLLGTFSGGTQLWAAPVKVTLGALAASLICLPSLYIFSALAGMDLRPAQTVMQLVAGLALLGLLLLSFAPVLWIFTTSTESIPFVGALTLAFWLISLKFGSRLMLALAKAQGMNSGGFLRIWMGIFLLVTLQMSTSLRPLIGTAPSFLPQEKRFFVDHWWRTLSESRSLSKEGATWRQQ